MYINKAIGKFWSAYIYIPGSYKLPLYVTGNIVIPFVIGIDGSPLPSLLVPLTIIVILDEGLQCEEDTSNSCLQTSSLHEDSELLLMVILAQT